MKMLIMQALTVIYTIKYLMQVIEGANKLYDVEFWLEYDKSKKYKNLGRKLIKSMTLIVMDLIEIPYMCIALSYEKNIITIGFIIFWFVIFTIRQILKNRENKSKRKMIELINRIINLIDLSYFMYMFYVLFLK